MKYSVELKKTIYVMVEAENMYDMMDQLENHDLCKKDGYIIKTAHLLDEEEYLTTDDETLTKNEI